MFDQLDLLRITFDGPVAHVRLNRPAKRNAISDALVGQIHTAFAHLSPEVRVAVLRLPGAVNSTGPLSLAPAGPAARPSGKLAPLTTKATGTPTGKNRRLTAAAVP